MFSLRVEAEVRPTEDAGKVLKAITNLFHVDKHELIKEGRAYPLLVAESNRIKSLSKLHEVLRQDRILDTARKMFESGVRGDTLRFKLHKQSAYAGHVSFIHTDSESPLGPIIVNVRCDRIPELIDWLAPKTRGGRPLWERPPPEVH
ncbi:MAG: hypothetical protein J7L55_05025 [Desulfurococcales archaeon]|nr:hypothetical protein [Desulfurococcales archaeon]